MITMPLENCGEGRDEGGLRDIRSSLHWSVNHSFLFYLFKH